MEKEENTEQMKNLMKDLFTANPQHNEGNPLEKKKKEKGSEKGSNEGSMQLSFKKKRLKKMKKKNFLEVFF